MDNKKIELIERIKTTPNPEVYIPRKLCVAENINRTIDEKRARELMWSLRNGWRKECGIYVFPAESVKNTPKGENIELVDIETGYKLGEEELQDYFLIMDGQHRVKAQIYLNLASPDFPTTNIPSSLITLHPEESLIEYLVIINTHKDWTKRDKIRSSAAVNNTNPVLSFYNEHVAEKLGEVGKFPVSVLNMIVYGNEGAIKTKEWDKIMKGEKTIPSGHNLEKAKRFINILREKFTGCNYTSRYLPEVFLRIQNETGKADDAFKVFEALTNKDVADMNVAMKDGKPLKKFKMTEESINKVMDRVKAIVLE